jgi:hypothetical protein
MTGAELIAQERNRQLNELGYTSDIDDSYTEGELLGAALSYAFAAGVLALSSPEERAEHGLVIQDPPETWPWHPDVWHPADTAVGNYAKAGALMAAEMDRVARLTAKENTSVSQAS